MGVPLRQHDAKLQDYVQILYYSWYWAKDLATYNLFQLIDNVQDNFSDHLYPINAAAYLGAPVIVQNNYEQFLINMNLMEEWFSGVAQEDIKAPQNRDRLNALIDFMSFHELSDDGETAATLTNGSNSMTNGTAFDDYIAAGDYVYRAEDGFAYRQRVTVVAAGNCTLAGNYLGTTGAGDIIVERLVQSRNFTKGSPGPATNMANKATLYQLNINRYGFDIETPKKAGEWKFKAVQGGDYTGNIAITFGEGVQKSIIDANGCRPGEEKSFEIINPYSGAGILNASASIFEYSSTVSDLSNYGWYSTTAFADSGITLNDTVYAHREPGTKTPTNWTGTGSSCEFTGSHVLQYALNKLGFDYDRPYLTILRYSYEDASVVNTLSITLGSQSSSTTGQEVITGTCSFLNGNTSLTGVGTKFLTELRVGDSLRATAHGVANATEIASIESDTELTFVAGGYLGASSASVGSTNHHTGWHELYIFAYPYDFIEDGDLSLEIESAYTSGNSVFIDSCDIYRPKFYFGLGGYYFMFAGVTDIEKDDYTLVDISLPADSKVQRFFVEYLSEDSEDFAYVLPHVNTNPSIADPA
jgi:hypothetical protein